MRTDQTAGGAIYRRPRNSRRPALARNDGAGREARHGEAAKEKDFVAEGIAISRLEFSGAIPSKVILADGKVSSVTLDAFQADKGDLPASSQKA